MTEKTEALTTSEKLAHAVLCGGGDKAVVSALADCLIELGHEYATECHQKGVVEGFMMALNTPFDQWPEWATEMAKTDCLTAISVDVSAISSASVISTVSSDMALASAANVSGVQEGGQ